MGKKDFFLDPDDSQTMGDINYMRVAKKLRRTFPKTLKNPEGFAIEKSISSEKENDFSKANQAFQAQANYNTYEPKSTFNSTPTPAPAPAPSAESTPAPSAESTPAPAPAPAPAPKRQPDTSMDMFRNMAKNIRR